MFNQKVVPGSLYRVFVRLTNIQTNLISYLYKKTLSSEFIEPWIESVESVSIPLVMLPHHALLLLATPPSLVYERLRDLAPPDGLLLMHSAVMFCP